MDVCVCVCVCQNACARVFFSAIRQVILFVKANPCEVIITGCFVASWAAINSLSEDFSNKFSSNGILLLHQQTEPLLTDLTDLSPLVLPLSQFPLTRYCRGSLASNFLIRL